MQLAKLVQCIKCGGDGYLPLTFPFFFTYTSLMSSTVPTFCYRWPTEVFLRCIRSSGSSDDVFVRFPSSDLCPHVKSRLVWSLCLPSSDFVHVSSQDQCMNGPLLILGLCHAPNPIPGFVTMTGMLISSLNLILTRINLTFNKTFTEAFLFL